mgnify:CR=1 FL=1
MPVKVGIPRALMYYEYFPLWKAFFNELGVDVLLSAPTTKTILNQGVSACVDEACLPVKLFHGHVLDLKDKVDYIFIPRLKSVSKGEYICPKFCGIPEMIKYSIKDIPPIIDVEINLRNNYNNLYKSFLAVGKLFTNSRYQINTAYNQALKAHYQYKSLLKSGRLPGEILEGKRSPGLKAPDLTIAVIGHVYNIYDSYISMDLLNKLRKQNIKIITPEQIDNRLIENKAETLPKRMFWTFGKRLLGSVLYLIEHEKIDGIIYIMSFGCGIDAFVAELSEIKVRKSGSIPFFLLTLDEHSGDAGVNTRLEAFIDMIIWRKQNEGNIPSHG